ncbi:unnamed protein product [Zymoseptoria tritici ST99CH_1A5]|uniref:Transcription factor BYE1 n=1 Tax=Zymoseptoria tritici ST99CH_1A5 TaxID=1276529 RepID=A0A1Y6LJH8_ZYMTR|nr:unnamed protein product [Zymoseptoria tritici ST99CH_3D1]SMY23560.1 unnamed protein product [Zymoseptoria tritici ST99CH_1A5]
MSGKHAPFNVDGNRADALKPHHITHAPQAHLANIPTDEPRRSGRATKGQHKNASSSPAPQPKPTKGSKTKSTKKSAEPDPAEEEEDEDDEIRCICGNTNPKDKRAFIGCDACSVWQHNICMGIPDDQDDIPEHYFCEECRPEEHQETIDAIARGEKIWETRNKIYLNEKKMSKSRKSKGRAGEDGKPAWLKKDIPPVQEAAPQEEQEEEKKPEVAEPVPVPQVASNGRQESSNKRKREEPVEEPAATTDLAAADAKPSRTSRQDKRRKSSVSPAKAVPDTAMALVSIDQLPKNRQGVAQGISTVIVKDLEAKSKAGYKIPNGQTAQALGDQLATRIEYELDMVHGVGQPDYRTQFMAIRANLVQNKTLLERLINGSLSANELALMSTSDMASEELQRERAELKEVLDRQAVAIVEEGPRYAQDHKGYRLIEDETRSAEPTQDIQAAAQKPSVSHERSGSFTNSGSPVQTLQRPLSVDVSKSQDPSGDRRPSSQQFDMGSIWAKTSAQSPTVGSTPSAPRPMQAPARRQSSTQNGAMDDPDVDRMLQDNDDYAPVETTGEDTIVWRGKLVQNTEESAPTVNARFVAGRDLAPTVSWNSLLPNKLSIDGRLQIKKAEDYLCGLRWSSSSDVTVLSLKPYDNAAAFNEVFDYFNSRQRYAVIEKDKPPMVKDLYIIPIEVGGKLPSHVEMLEHCSIKQPIEERLLLATLIVARTSDSPVPVQETPVQMQPNGQFPPHVRQSLGGPSGSPLNGQNPTFSPPNATGYGAPQANAFPPNPYGPPPPVQQRHSDPLVERILGDMQFAPTVQMIFREAVTLTEEQLRNLRLILDSDKNAATDFQALADKLYGQRP